MASVYVKFLEGKNTEKEYRFNTVMKNLVEGDLVVVNARDSFQVARVTKYLAKDNYIEGDKWVVEKVNLKSFEMEVARQNKVFEQIKADKKQKEKRQLEISRLEATLEAQSIRFNKLLDMYKDLKSKDI